ncbi:Mth938-like domain-containing protein [Polynucleobacter sp. 30F-ANTBAC]|jgi:uncharacterized protein|uniref:Mth938-like domain-containing protein n=1 Tax=Polynucleobacter sp. 30F-ANTBAC TaxID=2689095 RepID=UPI001C0DA4E0|nr:Mth938-like domain-containing protein [Polynucleobacter sp. 30F-ANTBAC]MBU3599287.1 Mth938-like domain-containing protein [Polynucleobacter sp. 30F-ANTBAC]
MKLQPDRQPTLNTVSAYGSGYIEINATRYETSLLLQPEGPVTPWSCKSFAALSVEDFEVIALKKPALVILGSGLKIQFPRPELIAPLIKAKIGIETMDLQAACRTYNVLMAEGRNVLAALIMDH